MNLRLPPLCFLLRTILPLILAAMLFGGAVRAVEPVPLPDATSLSLNGMWLLAPDPKNIGRDERWFEAPRPEAKPVKVPWIIQDEFPAYHGAAWYWLDFIPPANPLPQGRSLLRFTNVDYSGEIWLNGTPVGKHEGAETPFELDVTDQIKAGQPNRLAVRVMNPDNSPTDGLALHQTPRGARVVPYRSGACYNAGGITGEVKLLQVPAVRLEDLSVVPDPKTGRIRVEATVHNALTTSSSTKLEFSAAPAANGETLATVEVEQPVPPGTSVISSEIKIPQPHLWDLSDPFLYRVTSRLTTAEKGSFSERSVRCGFRDFRVEDGYFRLNGRRLFLRSTHTTGSFPIGQNRPQDRDLARRDMINLKMMGFNIVRFIWGGSEEYVLDLCDELGLMVYQETLASQPMEDSPRLGELFDATVGGVIRRDRNHPSIVIWGLLNEAQLPKQDAAFRHATKMLPLIRSLDENRAVILNSGRFDGLTVEKISPSAKRAMWQHPESEMPWVACTEASEAPPLAPPAVKDFNPTNPGVPVAAAPALPPSEVILQPGEKGKASVVRWSAPEAGNCTITARFHALSNVAGAAAVEVLHCGKSLYKKNLSSTGYPIANFSGSALVSKGDTIDFVVGPSQKEGAGANTSLKASLDISGKTYDVLKDYSRSQNPAGPWSYGSITVGSEMKLFAGKGKSGAIGSMANPGSSEWQDLVMDDHTYPRVPHTAGIIQMFRDKRGQSPVFLSEYGIGSAVDLWRVVRHFERLGKTGSEEGQYFQERLNRYLADWKNWKMDEVFARPEDFFHESLSKMAGQRTLGLNAIRANPNIIGYSLTSGIGDPVNGGEGLTTVFRELKPGAVDAIFEGFSPLRWCLFVEPVNVYRGSKVRLEAVLANEDSLPAGEYPGLVQVAGPNNECVFERKITVTVPAKQGGQEAPFAIPVFQEEVPINGPAGTYKFLVTLEKGGAPTGGEIRFFVDDPALMPRVDSEVVLWGDDPVLSQWLPAHGIKVRPFTAGAARAREVILVGAKSPGNAPEAFAALAQRIAQGSTAIFLAPEVLQKNGNAAGWLPLANKGSFTEIKSWLYLKDEWAKRHPIFEGLPAGGLLDPVFYREIIPDTAWIGQDPPAEAVAGAIKASEDYSSGLMVSVYPFGSGRFILSNLLIRENLGTNPVAERLLRNIIRYAARDAGKPPTILPANFDAQLQAIGYK